MSQSGLTPGRALERARAELGIEASVNGEAELVDRIDEDGVAYFLIVFGEPTSSIAVAAIDRAGGGLLSSARLPGAGPHRSVNAAEAIERAGLEGSSTARLVWKPSRQSRSPLYPLWEVRAAEGTVYVDEQGRVWPELEPGGPGGA
ncbi:MAG: hypothetical protein ACRDN6_10345 [Gaiellaceae bacterium]